tara:strand:+ start:4469 stop:5521 length:1053 start_codon:yes stop_codon:yes gene_type:complete
MFPWKLDHFMKVLCGMGTSDVSRLQGFIQGGADSAPDFETLQALFDPNKQTRRSTFEKYTAKESGKDLGLIHDFLTNESFIDAFADWDGRYRSAFEVNVNIIKKPQEFNCPPEGDQFMSALLGGFSHLISNILHLESVVYGEVKEQPIRDFPTKLPVQEFRDQLRQWPNEEKAKVFELHAFMLYMASIELDFGEWEAEFDLMSPSYFVPGWEKGRIVYPMKTFWTWLRNDRECSTWKQLAEKLKTPEQSVKNHANTKSLKKTPSWSEFWRMMNNAQVEDDRTSSFIFKTSIAYGIARIMQEHTHRCVDYVTEYFCEPSEIANYYLARIKDMKQNECRSIPLHPSFTKTQD